MRKIYLGILIFSTFLIASEDSYISNKKYTYDEVTEILSDKIIENKKKIDDLKKYSYKENSEVKRIIDNLQIKVENLSRQINNTKIEYSNNNENLKDEKNIKYSNAVEEIIIEKELLEKVK